MASEKKKTVTSKSGAPVAAKRVSEATARLELSSATNSAPREELLVSAKSFVRKAGEPIWSQISRSVEEQIVAGNLPSGTRLPTETQLAASFEVNRHTLRRALRELVRKGLITATPRRGTIVSRRRIPFTLTNSLSFDEVIASSGREPGDHLLSHCIGKAPKEMAEWLGIAERFSVVELQFIRVANGVPFCLSSCWMPADRFERIGNLVDRLGCLEKAVTKLGVTDYTRHQSRITSQPADQDEMMHLEISRGASVLVVDSLYADEDGEPILVSHNRFAADRIELVV